MNRSILAMSLLASLAQVSVAQAGCLYSVETPANGSMDLYWSDIQKNNDGTFYTGKYETSTAVYQITVDLYPRGEGYRVGIKKDEKWIGGGNSIGRRGHVWMAVDDPSVNAIIASCE